MERLVGQSLNRYKLTNLLGEGGMGAVFKARDVTLQRDVAIKIMHPHLSNQPDFRERFLQEARTAARLDHPSIVQVYDFGQERSLLFIVMEFIRGANLRQMLDELKAQSKWIPLDEAVQIIRHVALAMDYAHRQGVLHRDLKPSNIMIEPEASEGLPYRPVLTDLGLARLMQSQHITQAGTSMGTPTYMSPEQALGEETDARSDVYSLGVMLYELAVARPPFPVKTISEAIRYHTKETPQPPSQIRPDLPKSLEQVILRAMAKDPAQRWPNAASLAEALAGSAGEATAVATTPAATQVSVSLMTQYQRSLSGDRGASVLQELAPPAGQAGAGASDMIQARLPDGSTVEAPFVGDKVTLGRAEDNDLPLQSANVSRYHARIEATGPGHYQVVDLDSTNGTYIGNAKLLPGVPETWTTDQPLRVGDVWLRLVAGRVPVSRQPPTSKLGAGASVGMPLGRTHVDRSMVRTSTGEGRVGVVMQNTQMAVAPGEQVVTTLMLLNQGPIVDHFQVTVEGIPATWADLPPVVQLMPGAQQEVALTLRPPRTPESRAGRYSITVRVISRDAPNQFVDVRASLTVGAYSHFQSSLQPQKVRAGKTTQVTIRNNGNFPDTYTISGSDRANELAFEPPETQLKVNQGEAASAELRAGPVKRPLVGGAKTHPFTVQVAPSQGDPQQHAGELVSRGIIPSWVPPLLVTLLLVTCGILAFLLTRPPVIELAEIIPTNPQAGEPVTVRWRVSRAQRIELRPFGIEVGPGPDGVGEYTFEDGFPDATGVTLVASNTFRSSREDLDFQVSIPVVDPVITEWSVFPTEITQGQEVTIRWSVTNADSVRLQPFGTVDSSGERKDTPQQTETYTLIATNQGRSVEQAQRVIVATPAPDAPRVTSFTANPTTVVEGETATVRLTWETEQADTVTIEPGLGPVGLTGSRDVPAPASDTVYTLVARGAGGEITAQVQVLFQAQRCLAGTNNLRLRSGPGTIYDPPLASLPAGTELKPLAYSAVGFPDGQWVQVQVVGTGEEGWVAREFLSGCNVDVTGLGSAPFPPTPTPPFTVSDVQASVAPTSFTGACAKQFDFTGQITANGVGTVTYRWERSDGVNGPDETVDFDGPGTKAVNTSWSLSTSGTHWQQLHVLAPNDVTSNQASFTLNCVTRAVYVYDTDMALAQSYQSLLQENQFVVDLVRINSVLSTSFEDYTLVLVGPDTGSGGTWGDAAGNQATHIEDSGKPVVGLGEGGYAFFGKLGYPIGWGEGWHGSGRNVYVMDPDHAVWKSPNATTVPGSRTLDLYQSNSSFVSINYPSPISGITGIGREVGDDNHYPLISKDSRYVLWGWDSGPSAMTGIGRQVFVNTSRSVLGLRLILVPRPVLINP